MSAVAELTVPDAQGHFGPYGGRFVPETLMHPLQQLEEEYLKAQHDSEFQRELQYYLREFCGRPTPLYLAERLTRELDGPKIYLKREDLLHTGAHKINNTIGQILLAKRMRKQRIIAETGAGQHGVATATVAVATPCCPAPVSAMMRFFPMRLASRIWPMQLLILCAPVWSKSSRLR